MKRYLYVCSALFGIWLLSHVVIPYIAFKLSLKEGFKNGNV